MKRLTLEIESDLGNVSMASLAIHAICLYAGLNADQSNQVELCLVEAITNSIRHAYHGELDHSIVIAIVVGKEYLHFDIYDMGTPMPVEQVERLINGEGNDMPPELGMIDLTSLPEGGRGLPLIHRIMDEIAYTRVGTRNRLSLIKRIPITPAKD